MERSHLAAATVLTLMLLSPGAHAQIAAQARNEVNGHMPAYCAEMIRSHEAARRQTCLLPREERRQLLLDCARPFPPDTVDFEMKIIASEQREGYWVHKISYRVSAWTRANALLLVPDGEGTHPAALLLHDHGAHFSIGKEKMIRPLKTDSGLMADAEAWVEKNYDGVFLGDRLAREGYVVLCSDALLWGERQTEGGTRYADQQAVASVVMQAGYSLGGLMLHDDLRAAELLASLPQVDTARIASVGFSMGALRSWLLAAATDRVKASAAVSWMATNESLLRPGGNQTRGGSAWTMLLPGLPVIMDYPEAAAIASPKPALFISGRRDKLFPADGVEQAYGTMHALWQPGQLTTLIDDADHRFTLRRQEQVIEWLRSIRF